MKIPFIGKKEEPKQEAMLPPEEITGDAENRKSADQIDLISRFLDIQDNVSEVSGDWPLFSSNDNDEEFFRGMHKCALNAEVLIKQAAKRHLAREKAKTDIWLEAGVISKEQQKEMLRKAAEEALECAKIAKTSYKIVASEPHMVAILKRNRSDNPFAHGAFVGQAEAGADEEPEGIRQKLAQWLGGKKKEAQ